VVGTVNVDSRWDESAFVGIGAGDVVPELSAQGLISCFTPVSTDADAGTCSANHPLILPLLHEFLPPPPGVSDGAFYSCVTCYAQDAAAFDSQQLAAALHDRVFDPARHAAAILSRWVYLTRLFTTISPAEMTLDPLFEARTDEPPIALPLTATWRRTMTSASGFTLPGGRMVALDGGSWPAFTSAMPWTTRIDRFPAGKPAKLVADNTSAIQAELDKWNASQGWPLPPPNCPGPPTTLGAGGQGGAGGTFATPPGTGGGQAGSGGSSHGGRDAGIEPASGTRASSDSGCAVSRDASPGSDRPWLALIGAIAALARRRRARRGD
jgi:MYXO-CTERM domain-containing protein